MNKNNRYISSNSSQFFAFNIWDIQSAKSVIDAASIMEKPVILQTSMKAFSKMDLKEMRMFVNIYSEKKNVDAYLHLDHCKNIEMIESAVDNNWDSVMIDASDKSLEENIKLTNEVKKSVCKKGILLEAEVGQITGVEDEITVSGSGIANINDVRIFVDNTDVDMLAIAIGTAHGQYKGIPKIHYDIIEKTRKITDIPIVVHGGSGLSEETFLELLSYKNVKKINISTEVKQAYRSGIIKAYESGQLVENGFDPLVVMTSIQDSITNMTIEKLRLLK